MKTSYIKAKFLGIAKAFENMPDSMKGEDATPMLLRDYNTLIEIVKQNLPELTDLMPPEATFSKNVMGGKRADHRNIDLYIWCSQMYRLLEAVEKAQQNP